MQLVKSRCCRQFEELRAISYDTTEVIKDSHASEEHSSLLLWYPFYLERLLTIHNSHLVV